MFDQTWTDTTTPMPELAGPQTSSSSSGAELAIGLAIGGGVILTIGLAVLMVMLYRRDNAASNDVTLAKSPSALRQNSIFSNSKQIDASNGADLESGFNEDQEDQMAINF